MNNVDQLQEVAPEPVAVVGEEKTLTPIPTSSSEGDPHPYITRTIGLLRSAQKWSALPFLAFGIVHGIAVVAVPAIGGGEMGNQAVELAREVYGGEMAELGLVVSGAVHVGAGLALAGLRRIRAQRWILKFHPVRASGWILGGLLAAHVWAVRVAPGLVASGAGRVDLGYVGWSVRESLVHGSSVALALVGLVTVGVFHAGAGLGNMYPRGTRRVAQWARSVRWARLVRWAVLGSATLAIVAVARVSKSLGGDVSKAMARRFRIYDTVSVIDAVRHVIS